jgi:hypothetical protein
MYRDLERLAAKLPTAVPVSIDDLNEDLRIFSDGRVDVWYAPVGYLNAKARLAIFGITPGWRQMSIAYDAAITAIQNGLEPEAAHRMRKPAVAFAGSMRKNLVSMLDELGLHKHLGMDTTANMFGTGILHTGSVLRYPVFVNGRNYNGHSPDMLKHPALREMLDNVLVPDLRRLTNTLILPLGKAVEAAFEYAGKRGLLDPELVLAGFPHPSGANGHRVNQFKECKRALRSKINRSFQRGI